MENVYLYPQEPSKPVVKNLRHNWVDFDRSGNKCKNKAFFEIRQTNDVIIKLSVKILLMRQ